MDTGKAEITDITQPSALPDTLQGGTSSRVVSERWKLRKVTSSWLMESELN